MLTREGGGKGQVRANASLICVRRYMARYLGDRCTLDPERGSSERTRCWSKGPRRRGRQRLIPGPAVVRRKMAAAFEGRGRGGRRLRQRNDATHRGGGEGIVSKAPFFSHTEEKILTKFRARCQSGVVASQV